jgi:hypothetical protein
LSNFVTIMTFNHPTELLVLRSRLEADGIECSVLDELTAQLNPFYSNAIGGVKLQVKESDLSKAITILKESGYIKEEELQISKRFTKFDNATSRLPILNNLRLELRLMIIVAIGLFILIGIIYYATLPTTFERLTKQSWCVNEITYNGKNFAPKTVKHIKLIGAGFCEESIDIEANETITLPGFSSHAARGQWSLGDNSLQILQVDTFGFVYNGLYNIEFIGKNLVLKSNQTTLYCHPENIEVNLPFYRN